MKRLSPIVLGMCLLVAAGTRPLWSQELSGRPILDIQFEGLEALTPETLLFYLELEQGQVYNAEELNDKVHALWGRGLVDDISIEGKQLDDGVRLLITIKERPTLRSVNYKGLKKVERNDITDRIAKDRIRVREGDPLNMGELFRLKAAIEDLYAEKGFRLAEAQFNIERVSVTDCTVDFSIDEGDKVRIEDIDFEGNTVYRDLRLRFVMKNTQKSNWITRVLKKDVYNTAKFDEDLDKLRALYRKAGYKNVVIGDPQVDLRAKKPSAETVKEQKRRMFITVPIEEGDRWKLGEITIEGNERFSDELLLRLLKKPQGGWLKASVIDDGVETITEVYSNSGHLFVKVETELVERENQVADLIIHVDEGEQYRIGRIEILGNTRTKDKVIRREMGIQEGYVLNTGALKNSLLRIGQLEFFHIDQEDPVAFDFNEEEKTVDLTLNGEEGERTELLFGGGFSEIDGFFGQVQFRTRNFLGRGETVAVSLQAGSRQSIFDVSYFVPWFLNKPQNAGIQLFKRSLDYSQLSSQNVFQDSQGVVLTYGRNLSLFRTLTFAYTFADTDERRTAFSVTGEPISQEFKRTVSSLRVSFTKDRRDSRLQPTMGMRYGVSADVAGGVLGGDTDFYRLQPFFTKYLPVTKTGLRTVVAFNTRLGWVEPYGGQILLFNDRFYLGGENSIRGFEFRSIWVRDKDGNTVTDPSGFPLGGERSFQMNLEYILLVGGPFRVVLFQDTGKVFLGEQDFSAKNFSATAGVEFQVNVPMLGAPLRFIYSSNIRPFPDDRFQTFQFSIGPSF
ncbi:MAG: outer membrane protein assembly factor BamA [Thermoanaerobaculia bacterium]